MTFILRILSWIFGITLGVGIIAILADQMLLQPAPVIKAIPASAYTSLSQDLPATLAKLTPLTASQQQSLQQFITPQQIQTIVSSLVTGELDYLHGKGQVPQLDLSSIAISAQSQGVDLSPQLQAFLEQPQPLGSPQTAKALQPGVKALDAWRYDAPIAALVLAVIIFFVAGHRRFHYLSEGLIVAAIVVGAGILIALVTPALVASGISTSALTPLADPIRDALTAAVHQYTRISIQAIVGLIILAVALFVFGSLFGHRHKHS